MPSAVVSPDDVLIEFTEPQRQKIHKLVQDAQSSMNSHHLFIHIDEHQRIIASKRANYGIGIVFAFFLGFGIAFLIRTCK